MKKIFILIAIFFMVNILPSLADDKQEALNFFNNYVKAANSYSNTIQSMYSPNAKIIRQVVKPDGKTVDVYTDTKTYMTQMKIGQAGARLRKYTNTYTNINAEKVATGYKVSSLRQPSGETYKLKTYMILTKQPDGKWLITEEMMQTKEQIFLKYAK